MPFPYTNLHQSKRRPVLLLRQLAVSRDDWLVCMVSSRIRQADPDLDWVLHPVDPEFASTGLKVASVFRLSRLAVLDGALLLARRFHKLVPISRRIWVSQGNFRRSGVSVTTAD